MCVCKLILALSLLMLLLDVVKFAPSFQFISYSYSMTSELKGCPRPVVENGEVAYPGESNSSVSPYAPISARAVVTCHEGYTVQGLAEVTCSSSGQWHPSVPKYVFFICVLSFMPF